MDMITISAKTLDEAITKALLELQTTTDHLHYEVVQAGSSGFLGLFGGKQCVIRATVMGEEEEKNKKAKAEAERKAKEEAEKAARIKAEKAEKAEKVEKAKPEPERKVKEEKVKEEEKTEKAAKAQQETSEELSIGKPQKKYYEQKDYEKKKYNRREGRSDNREKPERRNMEVSAEKPEPKVRTEVKMDEAVVQAKAKEFLSQVFGAMGMQVSIETSVNAKEGELLVMMTWEF